MRRTIIVKGYTKKECLYFEVIDNGKGMSAKKLREFKEHINDADSDTGKRRSIKNVHQRIRLYYGNEYGISITSKENKGTRVVLEMPVINEQEPHPVPGKEQRDV